RAARAAVPLPGNPAARRSLCERLGRTEHLHRTIFRTAAGLGAAGGRDIRDAVLALSNRQFRIRAGLVGGAAAVRRRDRANRRMAVAHRLKLSSASVVASFAFWARAGIRRDAGG